MKQGKYDTLEMEKERLLSEINNFKKSHKMESDRLSNSSHLLTLQEIQTKKKRLESLKKDIDVRQKRYYELCTPSFFIE